MNLTGETGVDQSQIVQDLLNETGVKLDTVFDNYKSANILIQIRDVYSSLLSGFFES